MMFVLKVLKTSDEEKVKGQLLRMVHSLFLQVFFSAIRRARYQQVHLLFGRYSNSMVVVVSDHSTGRGLLDESHV